MKKFKRIGFLAAAVLFALGIVGCSLKNEDIVETEEAVTEEPVLEVTGAAGVEYVNYYFRNTKLLNQHYEKHGKDMGFETPESYEKAASNVINNPDALFKVEQEDGDYIYYIEETNEFVILSTDGYIRTYFKPDAGKKYFDKQ